MEQLSSGQYRASFETYGVLKRPPAKYYVNVTDRYGNEVSYLVEVESSGAGRISKAAIASGGLLAVPEPEPTLIGDELLGGVLILGGLAIAVADAHFDLTDTSGEQSRVAFEYGISATEAVFEDTAVGTVELPVGFAASEYDARIGEQVQRGFGWEYIAATSSLTVNAIEYALTHDPTVYRNGEAYYVIGRTPYGDEVVLTIIGGTLVAADISEAYDDVTYDPCGQVVWTREHAVAEKKPINDLKVVNQQLRDKDAIQKILHAQGGQKRIYIIKYAENKFYTLVAQPFELGGWLLQTMLTAKDGGFYHSLEKALEDLDYDAKEISDGNNYRNC